LYKANLERRKLLETIFPTPKPIMSREGVFKKVGTAKLKEEEFPSNV
jgi:hypothetical protein